MSSGLVARRTIAPQPKQNGSACSGCSGGSTDDTHDQAIGSSLLNESPLPGVSAYTVQALHDPSHGAHSQDELDLSSFSADSAEFIRETLGLNETFASSFGHQGTYSAFPAGGVTANMANMSLVLGNVPNPIKFNSAIAKCAVAFLLVKKNIITDKQAHCYISCTLCEVIGTLPAAAIGLLKEAWDQLSPGGSKWSWADVVADVQGLACCNGWISCLLCCIKA